MVSSNSNKKKPSVSGQPNSAALVTVIGSELDFYTNSNYLAYQLPQYAAAQQNESLGSDNLDADGSDDQEDDEDREEDGEDGSEDSEGNERPGLSDIQVVSNEIVYDSASNPSAKVVFKVKNSSGLELKTIEVRVEKK